MSYSHSAVPRKVSAGISKPTTTNHFGFFLRGRRFFPRIQYRLRQPCWHCSSNWSCVNSKPHQYWVLFRPGEGQRGVSQTYWSSLCGCFPGAPKSQRRNFDIQQQQLLLINKLGKKNCFCACVFGCKATTSWSMCMITVGDTFSIMHYPAYNSWVQTPLRNVQIYHFQ